LPTESRTSSNNNSDRLCPLRAKSGHYRTALPITSAWCCWPLSSFGVEPLVCLQDGLHIAGPVAAFFGQLWSYIVLVATLTCWCARSSCSARPCCSISASSSRKRHSICARRSGETRFSSIQYFFVDKVREQYLKLRHLATLNRVAFLSACRPLRGVAVTIGPF